MTFNEFMKAQFGVESCTTFWMDFGIADRFGLSAVRDTFERSRHWRSDYKMWTELCVVLNHRCWMHHDRGNHELSALYADLYNRANEIAHDTFTAEEFEYYYSITD